MGPGDELPLPQDAMDDSDDLRASRSQSPLYRSAFEDLRVGILPNPVGTQKVGPVASLGLANRPRETSPPEAFPAPAVAVEVGNILRHP